MAKIDKITNGKSSGPGSLVHEIKEWFVGQTTGANYGVSHDAGLFVQSLEFAIFYFKSKWGYT